MLIGAQVQCLSQEDLQACSLAPVGVMFAATGSYTRAGTHKCVRAHPCNMHDSPEAARDRGGPRHNSGVSTMAPNRAPAEAGNSIMPRSELGWDGNRLPWAANSRH